MVSIRRATIGDARAVAEISIEAWRAAFRGVLTDEYLDGLDLDVRTSLWSVPIRDPEPGTDLIVAEDASRPVGFAAFGPCASDESMGELYAIHLRPEVFRRGIGTLLLETATNRLRTDGFAEAVLWVVPENARARRFYEARGWVDDAVERDQLEHDVVMRERRYRTALVRKG